MLNSTCTALADIAARGPRELLPGHGRSRLAQLAAGPSCKQPRTLVPARSIKSTPLSNPVGPRRGGAAGQQHPALWGFYTPTLDFLGSLPLAACQWSSLKHPVPAPCHCRGYPQQVVPRVAQSILGPARRLGGLLPHHQHISLYWSVRQI